MQAMDARYDKIPIQQLTFKAEMESHFVFIPWHGRHVCVMLDPKYTPYYKQAPSTENFCLTSADLRMIDKQGSATNTVMSALASHVCDDSHLQ